MTQGLGLLVTVNVVRTAQLCRGIAVLNEQEGLLRVLVKGMKSLLEVTVAVWRCFARGVIQPCAAVGLLGVIYMSW